MTQNVYSFKDLLPLFERIVQTAIVYSCMCDNKVYRLLLNLNVNVKVVIFILNITATNWYQLKGLNFTTRPSMVVSHQIVMCTFINKDACL